MIVVDEYLAIRSLLGELPAELPDEPLALTTSAHWRILQRIHSPGTGQLSQALRALSLTARATLRRPSPAVLEILAPRPLLDDAATLAATFGGTGWLIAETLTAALVHGRQLWFGNERNIGQKLRKTADDLDITIRSQRAEPAAVGEPGSSGSTGTRSQAAPGRSVEPLGDGREQGVLRA